MRRFRHRRSHRATNAYERYYRPASARRRRSFGDRWAALPAETKRTIAGVIVIALGLTAGLALFGFAGPASGTISRILAQGVGVARWLVPVLLILLGVWFLRADASGGLLSRGLGGVLVLVGVAGIAHLPIAGRVTAGAMAGAGGGFLGLGVAGFLVRALGIWGSAVVLFAVAVIGTLLFFHTSFAQLRTAVARATALVQALRQALVRRRVRKLQAVRGLTPPPPTTFSPRDVPVPMDVEGADVIAETADEDDDAAGDELTAQTAKPKRRRPLPVKLDIPLHLLTGQAGKPTSGDLKANQYLIAKTFVNFGIAVEMGEVNIGPTVTQYTLKPADGVKLSRVVGLSDNLALALAAHPIRIEAPIPGRSLVGIEVPNQTAAIVPLREVLDSDEFRHRQSALMVALGKDVKGKPWLADLAKMPHLLIAGSTGSGKSVAINTLIISLLFQNGPGALKFILVDPKRVELPIYTGIPHLLTPVITDVKRTVSALKWTIHEMERRFDLLSAVHRRDIAAYNLGATEPLPYLVLVIDELADLMAAAGPEIEGSIIRLAQMSRAVGIHLVIATQRPSVDVLTGLIKANITTRIAFSVASLVDSRTILDMGGAEKLLGRGDMLYLSAEIQKPKRLQGAYAADSEIKNVIEHLKAQAEPEYLEEVTRRPEQAESEFTAAGEDGEDSDPLLGPATDVIVRAGKASASLLQRRLKVGYARAARILDLLEERGVVGPADGAKPRDVLLPRSPENVTLGDEGSLDPRDSSGSGADEPPVA